MKNYLLGDKEMDDFSDADPEHKLSLSQDLLRTIAFVVSVFLLIVLAAVSSQTI